MRDAEERLAARLLQVEPLSLLLGPAGWYLVAWCRSRRAVRGFLLDRVSDVEPGDEIAAAPGRGSERRGRPDRGPPDR